MSNKKCYIIALMTSSIIIISAIAFSMFRFKYLSVGDISSLLKFLIVLSLPPIFCVGGLFIEKLKRATLRSALQIINGIVLLFSSFILLFGIIFLIIASPFESKTFNINNYLKMDKYVEIFDFAFFPNKELAENNSEQYFYRYSYTVDPDFDVFLKVTFTSRNFQEEEARIKKTYADAEKINYDKYYEYRIIAEDNGHSYHFGLVRFFKDGCTIEYIHSYSMDYDETKPRLFEAT